MSEVQAAKAWYRSRIVIFGGGFILALVVLAVVSGGAAIVERARSAAGWMIVGGGAAAVLGLGAGKRDGRFKTGYKDNNVPTVEIVVGVLGIPVCILGVLLAWVIHSIWPLPDPKGDVTQPVDIIAPRDLGVPSDLAVPPERRHRRRRHVETPDAATEIVDPY